MMIDPRLSFYHDTQPEAYAQMAVLLGEPQPLARLPKVQVVIEQQEIEIALNGGTGDVPWRLRLEFGGCYYGQAQNYLIHLPTDLPLGYHRLELLDTQGECRIIVTPKKAFEPQAIVEQQHLWGAILQLYTLRSEHNWGIGDFGDLRQFLTELAKQGGHFVGLNPIHALFPANPESASPYSPSSRLWQNMLYIDVNAVEAFQRSESAQRWFHSTETQTKLAAARAQDFVDYPQVTELKLAALRLAYVEDKRSNQDDFLQFIADHGEALKIQATFDALHDWLSTQFPAQWGWTDWDSAYQDYHSPMVKTFQTTESEQIKFYMWLQFLAAKQLHECRQLATELAMPIGFYRDLAVGVADNGAETWADKTLYVRNASIGAPPDMLAPQGQNWGLSPMHPAVLYERGYQPFIDLLRANMKDCGALRIDHILGFARMWWVEKGKSAVNGVYVRYPLDDLLGILALESRRHHCLIIAEALGTVPEGMLEALEQKGILAFNIFYFENDGSKMKPLAEYPYSAMTTLSTHDLPTIKGYWQSYDFKLGEKFDIYPSEAVLKQLKATRKASKKAIRQAMQISQPFDEPKLVRQLQHYVAGTHSALYGTQPEDWLTMLEPVNIPGTSSEYPNWRRKLSTTTEAIFSDPNVQQLLKAIASKRQITSKR